MKKLLILILAVACLFTATFTVACDKPPIDPPPSTEQGGDQPGGNDDGGGTETPPEEPDDGGTETPPEQPSNPDGDEEEGGTDVNLPPIRP